MTQSKGYSRLQIILHWVVAVLIVLQFVLHEGMAEAYDIATETGIYAFSAPVIGHIAGGAVILLLACWRLILRHDRGAPPPPEGEPEIFRKAGHLAHLTLYALLIGLPITGALAWGGRMEAAGEAHELLKNLMILLVLAHIGAVIVHQRVWKTGILKRMMRAQD
ncbi:cytochrome b [Roseicyclus sp.]|uniref:cytochrome b n=1 Tax=Roseicyclus sp. TaxID=1914329 RepID=UPI003F6AF020